MAKQYDWAWQPFGPDHSILSFAFPGSHYRGFPVIKISDEERQIIRSGKPFNFRYRGVRYIVANGNVRQADK